MRHLDVGTVINPSFRDAGSPEAATPNTPLRDQHDFDAALPLTESQDAAFVNVNSAQQFAPDMRARRASEIAGASARHVVAASDRMNRVASPRPVSGQTSQVASQRQPDERVTSWRGS